MTVLREDICSIPVSEIFEEKDGCPVCAMLKTLEEHLVDYVTGAAMMEPDVRVETNRAGFCGRHISQMLDKQKRLSVALTLESHLAELEKAIFGGIIKLNKGNKASSLAKSCFVCDKVNWAMERQIVTVCRLYDKEKDFRILFAEQEFFCLNHYALLLESGQREISKRFFSEFKADLDKITKTYLSTLHADVSHFCSMFDYRNSEGDWGNSKDSLERAALFLNGV